jgi:hypothetical protein
MRAARRPAWRGWRNWRTPIISQVRESVQAFHTVEEATAPLRAFLDCWHALLWLPPVADGVPPGGDRQARAKTIKAAEQQRKSAINSWLDGLCGDPVALAGGVKPEGIPVTVQAVGALLATLRGIAARQRLLHWQPAFPGVWNEWKGMDARGGFDAVIGNPPWVRQESLAAIKGVLKERFETYEGKSDLSTFFLEQALNLVRPGGRVAFVLPNKFFKADYGESLRDFLDTKTWIERIVDFGHNRDLFPDADVFPCVLVTRRPMPSEDAPVEAAVAVIPGDRVEQDQLATTISDLQFPMPLRSLSKSGWVLEPLAVRALMERIQNEHQVLTEHASARPYRGVMTGFNEACVVDTATRDRLVGLNPKSAALFHPFLRGQDIERWTSDWAGQWMIFTSHGINIDQYPAIKAHLGHFRSRLEPRPENWLGGEWPGRKAGTYKWWEIQDSVAYAPVFDDPKIIYQEIQFYPAYSLDMAGLYLNSKGFMIGSSDPFLLAALNSPLLWWFGWRHFAHMKDEALTPAGYKMELLPIARPNQLQSERAADLTSRLAAVHRGRHDAGHALRDWLRVEWGLAHPPAALEAPFALSADAFADALRKALPRKQKLSVADVAAIKQAHAKTVAPVTARLDEAARLERELSAVVNAAYGLTPEEEALIWRTAPPRMPIAPPAPPSAIAGGPPQAAA